MTGRRRPAPHAHGLEETRQRISREAARIMAEEGVQDYHAAKRKAADRLNLPETRQLPSNQEIELALTEHLQLFHARQLPQTLRRLRNLAVQAMQLLERFEPRLVGSLLTGNVTRFSQIQLHVTADTPELVAFFLQEQGIPYEIDSKHLRYGGDRVETVPAYRFLAEDVPIELTIFTPTGAREAPLSPVDGRAMKRASLKELEAF
jgi:predicted component of type VI protein secretion system